MTEPIAPPPHKRHYLLGLLGIASLCICGYAFNLDNFGYVILGLMLAGTVILHLAFRSVLLTSLSIAAIFVFLLGILPVYVTYIRESAARMTRAYNLRQLVRAFHAYDEHHKNLPRSAILDQQGKPLLSWRVMMLPFVGEELLYRQFKLDEPWNSEHNLPLIPLIPKIYQPFSTRFPLGHTHIVALRGHGSIFDEVTPPSLAQVNAADGSSNTAILSETARFIPWTMPEDEVVHPALPAPWLVFRDFESRKPSAMIAFLDGATRSLEGQYGLSVIDPQKLHWLVTWKGNDLPPSFELDIDLFRK